MIYSYAGEVPQLSDKTLVSLQKTKLTIMPLQAQQQQLVQAFNQLQSQLGPLNQQLSSELSSALTDSGIDAEKCKCTVDPETLQVILKPVAPPVTQAQPQPQGPAKVTEKTTTK